MIHWQEGWRRMEAIEALLTRRSVRKLTAESLRTDEIETLLRAAMQAPSAMNEQPWEFMLVTERKLLDQVPGVHPYAGMAREAGAAIVVCSDKRRWSTDEFWAQGCAAAAQNILLAAHALGLGAVWVGVFPHKERVRGLRRVLGIPDHMMPFAFIPIGRPAETPALKSRYTPERVHTNRW